ncbi:MAG: hypothetical protein LC777_17345, partial [Actinobacteria bacterium]|nr:hypothetical protein [Actinomycetota bacterium]
MQGVDAFIAEVVRILGLLPQRGLIVDVRGNGGGIIMAGEWHHSRAHDFFARARWDPDRLGLAL